MPITHTTPDNIGETLLYLRSLRGMSRSKLADLAGLHMRTIQSIEYGARKPRLATCIRLASALDVPLAQLYTGQKDVK